MDDSDRDPFFMRFSWEDPAALAKEIEKASADLARARQKGDEAAQLKIASALGNMLTIARQEAPAVELLDWALPIARRLADREEETGVLLNLATGRQYLGEHDRAQDLFQQALDLAMDNKFTALEAFIQHHRGRCYAEQNKIFEARLCFERALHIRTQMGEPRAENSRRALEELAKR